MYTIYPSTQRRRRFFSITAFGGAFHIQVTKSFKNKKKNRKKGNKYTVDEYNNKWPGVITGVILCRTFLRRDKCFSMDYVL